MDFKKLLPLVAPFMLEFWTQVLYPELEKLEGQLAGGSADLQLIGQTVEDAIDKIVKYEIAKVAASTSL